jgi:hypothetical protein
MITNEDKGSHPQRAMAPPAYAGIAQVIGHTLTASAAMLAFFFVFQGTLLANFPALYDKFSSTNLGEFRIGRWALFALCLLALTFTAWSFLIVRLFITYFESFVTSGRALEAEYGNVNGLFVALRAAYDKPVPHRPLVWATWAFFFLLVLLWMALGTIALFGK